MPKISIKATKFSRTPEADEIFDQVDWKQIYDRTIIPDRRKVVNKGRHNSSLIGVEWEEITYD